MTATVDRDAAEGAAVPQVRNYADDMKAELAHVEDLAARYVLATRRKAAIVDFYDAARAIIVAGMRSEGATWEEIEARVRAAGGELSGSRARDLVTEHRRGKAAVRGDRAARRARNGNGKHARPAEESVPDAAVAAAVPPVWDDAT